ncbi:MAG: YbcC family protein [Congregibacter sp.]
MSAAVEQTTDNTVSVHAAATAAGQRIAPTWPLDQLIAVNPWWEMRDQSLPEVTARIALLGHANGHMPREWFREQFTQTIQREHLSAAVDEAKNGLDTEALIDWLDGEDRPLHWNNFSDEVDGYRDLARNVSWHDEIIHQISQFCASFYSAGTPLPSKPALCLYEAWLDSVQNDRGIEIMMGEKDLHRSFLELPKTAEALIAEACAELGVTEAAMTDYFHALLLDVNGWASWVAYIRWQSSLVGGNEDPVPQLLAVRLAWELVLWRHQHATNGDAVELMVKLWRQQFDRLPEMLERHRQIQQPAWIWQRAAEIAFQAEAADKLLSDVPAAAPAKRPVLQAALCIDVRSEVYRRALEKQHPEIQTLGFAGFFGLPIAYAPKGAAYSRPQLPGLLSPGITVHEDSGIKEKHRAADLNREARWSAVGKAAPASFGFVESIGLGYAFKLLRESLFGKDAAHPVNADVCEHSHFALEGAEGILDAAAQAELASGILGAMTLTENFAPVVLLAGHGSSTRNNPHAAGLDCGACGGQTGEINVRVLAQVLNDAQVREALESSHGISIPADTRFVAALHDTTTDDLHCLTPLPEGSQVSEWLAGAGAAARAERAGKLGVSEGQSDKGIRERSRDWSQVRPEWGLAGNACFIVAERSRIKHFNFGGRSFLHDYKWEADSQNGYGVLELIMTAPMIVTHWINMQYNSSVIDNERYGSGNKVLHNVVGGNLGVFEGNGGDLRIGLPMQSLHDGERWMHDTLRLSVYIDAPAEAIAAIAAKHEMVRQLLDNDWLYLFRIDDEKREIQRLYQGEWTTTATAA